MDSFVSVIVATRNRQALLARTLNALAAQRWPRDRFEIVVADNGSTDATASVVRSLAQRSDAPAVQYVHVATPGKSHAVNAALRHARGDLLAFTDDDVVPDRQWLAAVDRAFADTAVDFLVGRIVPDWEAPPPAWMSPALFGVLAIPEGGGERASIRLGLNEHLMPIGANMAVRAPVLRRLGGLRPDLGKLEGSLRTGEDHELFLRLLHDGRAGVYEPGAVVHHFVPRERLHPQYFRRWLLQNGRDVAKLEEVYPQSAARLAGIPRYLWRDAASAAVGAIHAALTGDARQRFAKIVRVIWIAGYAYERWFGRRESTAAAAVPTSAGRVARAS